MNNRVVTVTVSTILLTQCHLLSMSAEGFLTMCCSVDEKTNNRPFMNDLLTSNSYNIGTMPMFLVLKTPVRCNGISHLVFVLTANNLASSNVIVILN